jgi:hypothetical protein
VDSIAGPDGKPRAIGRIGVAVAGNFRTEPLTLGQAVVEGWQSTVNASTQIVRTVLGLQRRICAAGGRPILIGQLAGRAPPGLDAFGVYGAISSQPCSIPAGAGARRRPVSLPGPKR